MLLKLDVDTELLGVPGEDFFFCPALTSGVLPTFCNCFGAGAGLGGGAGVGGGGGSAGGLGGLGAFGWLIDKHIIILAIVFVSTPQRSVALLYT